MLSILDTGEPFGLPRGTVRGIIALGSFALLVYGYVVTNTIDPILLAFAGPYLGFYFGSRGNESPAEKPEPVAAPYVPGEDNA